MDTSPLTIIELREKSAVDIGTGTFGEWRNVLIDKVVINPGDAVAVKQAFIDTKSESSDVIKLEEPINISLENIVYNTNWDKTNKNFFRNTPDKGVNGYDFILCDYKTSGTLGNDYEIVDTLYLKSNKTAEKHQGINFKVTASYIDITGNVANWTSSNYEVPGRSDITLTIPVNLVAKKSPQFVVTNEDRLDELGIPFDKLATSDTTIDVFHPKHFTTNITVDAGTYDPSEIAQVITDKLSINTESRFFTRENLSTSAFLTNSQVHVDQNAWDNTKYGNYMRSDGNEGMGYDLNAYAWVGSSQIALEYDEPTQKFKWSFLHMPVYDDNGDIVTGIKENENFPALNEYFEYGRAGGVAFTKMEPVSFWEDTLGFDVANVTCKVTQTETIIDGIVAFTPVIDLTAGNTTTAGLTGLDSLIIKSNVFLTVPTPPFQTISSQTTGIRAARAFGIQGVDTGYFLIDIDAQMFNEVLGQNLKSHSIQAIVGRYYSADSYTSSQSGNDAIPYIHRGLNSFTLDSFDVRILNPDGTLAPNLGGDSTIFLEVRRAALPAPGQNS